MEILPQLEIEVAHEFVVKFNMQKRDRSRQRKQRPKDSYSLRCVEEQVRSFARISNILEDANFSTHLEKFRVEAIIDGLTVKLGGSSATIDGDLVILEQMKAVISNLDAVAIQRAPHDKGFLEMLQSSRRFRRIAGW